MRRPIPRTAIVPVLVVAGLLAGPAPGHAQEATLAGTVTDSTGGVLPGVTVTATHTASGNLFTAVTDERGTYRLPVRTGEYLVILELSGFSTVNRGLTLLVGQQAQLDVQMMPSGVQESVTVTGEAPLLNVRDSSLAANIDPRQMEELPVQGRNWQSLVLLASGSRANAIGENVPVDRAPGAYTGYQLNVDGQQITQMIVPSTFGNPKYSRDAIAEFQFVANRFDATQGRSLGVQVNAITKSGTNTLAGTVSGYFRDDRFNAADHIARRVLPYSNAQSSATLGGPIRRDRVHFFGNYEYEREPQTLVYQTPYPSFNVDLRATRREHMGGGRVDMQFTPATRLTVRSNFSEYLNPTGVGVVTVVGATLTPSAATTVDRISRQLFGTLTQVVSNRTVNEVKGGWARYGWNFMPNSRNGTTPGTPRVFVRGLLIGQGNQFSPQEFIQDLYSIRDDLTLSFTWRGRHDLRTGGEYLYYDIQDYFCNLCNGHLEANIAPAPANLEALFPNMEDASTWNLGALSPIAVLYRVGIGKFDFPFRRSELAGWAQDDWAITPRLTLNLGVRYDLPLNAFANKLAVGPLVPANRPNDTNNIAPRLGFTATVNERTVVRGGFGRFYGQVATTFFAQIYQQSVVVEFFNDGRPDFASNPFNGPAPTYDQAVALLCPADNPLRPRCTRPSITNGVRDASSEIPYSYQGSIGVQRQLAATMAITADYVYNRTERELTRRNFNLAYNPATGVNYPFSDVLRRPYPHWGAIALDSNIGRSEMHALETSFTKRFSDRWQAAATYALSGFWDEVAPPDVGFPLVPDMGAERALAATDQRHRAVFNGIWEVGRGLQLSGLYFFGSGQRFSTTWGPDLRIQGADGASRLRPDGTLVTRNNLVGKPIHRVDMRIQQQLRIGGRAAVQGIVEVYNIFNHPNFGAYTTQESSVRYGQPDPNPNVAYAPRTLQLGFRMLF
jgi:hypothetical protein